MKLTKIAAAVKVHIANLLTDKYASEISELTRHIETKQRGEK